MFSSHHGQRLNFLYRVFPYTVVPVPSWVTVSTGQCNTLVKSFSWCFEVEQKAVLFQHLISGSLSTVVGQLRSFDTSDFFSYS